MHANIVQTYDAVTQGPQGIVVEVTPQGEEVWRYVCPVVGTAYPGSVQYIRQGSTNFGLNVGSRSLFRYTYPAFCIMWLTN